MVAYVLVQPTEVDGRLSTIERGNGVKNGPPKLHEGKHADTLEGAVSPRTEVGQPPRPEYASSTPHGGTVDPGDRSIIEEQVSITEPYVFRNEAGRYLFLGRADKYSEKDLITECRALSSRISTLSARILQEKSRAQGSTKARASGHVSSQKSVVINSSETRDRSIAALMKKAIGNCLYEELTQTGKNGESPSELGALLLDGLDAWSAYCVYSAMRPMLFGFKLRTVDEIEEVFRHMVDDS